MKAEDTGHLHLGRDGEMERASRLPFQSGRAFPMGPRRELLSCLLEEPLVLPCGVGHRTGPDHRCLLPLRLSSTLPRPWLAQQAVAKMFDASRFMGSSHDGFATSE